MYILFIHAAVLAIDNLNATLNFNNNDFNLAMANLSFFVEFTLQYFCNNNNNDNNNSLASILRIVTVLTDKKWIPLLILKFY